jgi:hypothetical protein
VAEHNHVFAVVQKMYDPAGLPLGPLSDIMQCVVPGCGKLVPEGVHRGEDGQLYVSFPVV